MKKLQKTKRKCDGDNGPAPKKKPGCKPKEIWNLRPPITVGETMQSLQTEKARSESKKTPKRHKNCTIIYEEDLLFKTQ